MRRASATFRPAKHARPDSTPCSERLREAWRAARGGGRFPYRPTAFDRLCSWPLSDEFRLALQVSCAVAWAALFVVVEPMRFEGSQLAAVLTVIGLVLIPPHPNLGCRLSAVGFMLFTSLLAPLLAAVLASAAQACGETARPWVLTALSLLALVAFTAVRAAPGPAFTCVIPALAFGIGVIAAAPGLPQAQLWRRVGLNTLLSVLIAAAGMALSVSLVLPTLAAQQAADGLAAGLRGMGHQLSAFGSALVADPTEQQLPRPPLERLHLPLLLDGNRSFSNMSQHMSLPEERRSMLAFLEAIRERTDPARAAAVTVPLPPHPTTAKLRAAAALCKDLAAEALFEPAWLLPACPAHRRRSELVYASRALLTRINSLQILTEGGQLLDGAWMAEQCLYDPLPSLRLVFASLAAACKALSEAVTAAGPTQAQPGGTDWQQLRQQLAEAVLCMREGYWTRYVRENPDAGQASVPPLLEVRVVMFLSLLLAGITDSLVEVERCLLPETTAEDAPREQPAGGRSPAGSMADLEPGKGGSRPSSADSDSGERAGSSTSAAARSGEAEAAGSEPAQAAGSLQLELCERGAAAAAPPAAAAAAATALPEQWHGSEAAPAAEHSPAPSSSGRTELPWLEPGPSSSSTSDGGRLWLQQTREWAGRFAAEAWGRPFWARLRLSLWTNARSALGSREGLKAALRSRTLQFAFKYWLASGATLSLAIGLYAFHPVTRDWGLQYPYITVLVLMLVPVEAVAWKLVQRLLGTLIGGTVAYLLLLCPNVSARPAALTAAALAVAFLFLHAINTPLKYTCYLSTNTLVVLMLSSCIETCTPETDYKLWLTRVTGIAAGCAFCMAVSWAVLPAFASDGQLQTLAEALEAGARLFGRFYAAFHASCRAAAVAASQQSLDPTGRQGAKASEAAAAALMRELEAQLVSRVQAVLLGLSRDVVIWRRGPLSSPPVVRRVNAELRLLVRRMAALQLATKQGPAELGEQTAVIFELFIAPMHEEYLQLAAATERLAAATAPILRHGWSEARAAGVEAALQEMERCRVTVYRHYHRLRGRHHRASLSRGSALASAQDMLRVSSWVLATGKVLDQVMLIARTATAEGSRGRESRLTSLSLSFSWQHEARPELDRPPSLDEARRDGSASARSAG